MAFNNWPYTNFQDLNLGWILSTYKTALNKALEALGKANTVEAEVGTYTNQINAATLTANQASATANQAMDIARNADDVLFIYSDSENKAVNYKQYTEGVTAYITAPDIFSAVVADHKVPVFMDANMYFYEMAGYETNPEQPLMVTRVKFVKDGMNRQDIVWIDRSGAITYTTAYRSGGTLVVNITRSSSSGTTTSDTTYAAIESAYENGMTVQCHVVDELNGLKYYAYDCFFTENNDTGDYFGWYSPFDYTNSRFYRAFVREDGLAGISNIPVSGGGGGGISIQDVIDTVNDGDTNALVYTAQSLSAAQQAQVKQNLGITGSGDFILLRMNQNGDVYNGSTAITGTQINTLAATNKAVFLWDEDNERLYTYTEQGTSAGQLDGTAEFVSPLSNGNGCYLVVVNAANNNSTFYENNVPFQTPRVAMASTDTTPTLYPNKLYVFPEIATLTPTLATPTDNTIVNEYHFVFDSGATATVLTLPASVLQPYGFTVEANMHYEVSILEGAMTAQGWSVRPNRDGR